MELRSWSASSIFIISSLHVTLAVKEDLKVAKPGFGSALGFNWVAAKLPEWVYIYILVNI